MHVMCECHIAHAKVVVRAQRTERVLNGMTAFDTHERCDATFLVCGANVSRRARQHEGVGVPLDHTKRDIDLLELRARKVSRRFAWRVHGPELPTHTAFTQT